MLAEAFEWRGKEGETPVSESIFDIICLFSSRARHEKPCLNLDGPPPKSKYGK